MFALNFWSQISRKSVELRAGVYLCKEKHSSLKLLAQQITRDTAAVRAAEAKSSSMRTQEETHGQVET